MFYYDVENIGSSGGRRGIGLDLATLDSALYLSQVLLSATMGYLVYITGNVLMYIVVAAAFGLAACICIFQVIYTKKDMIVHIRTCRDRRTDVK